MSEDLEHQQPIQEQINSPEQRENLSPVLVAREILQNLPNGPRPSHVSETETGAWFTSSGSDSESATNYYAEVQSEPGHPNEGDIQLFVEETIYGATEENRLFTFPSNFSAKEISSLIASSGLNDTSSTSDTHELDRHILLAEHGIDPNNTPEQALINYLNDDEECSWDRNVKLEEGDNPQRIIDAYREVWNDLDAAKEEQKRQHEEATKKRELERQKRQEILDEAAKKAEEHRRKYEEEQAAKIRERIKSEQAALDTNETSEPPEDQDDKPQTKSFWSKIKFWEK